MPGADSIGPRPGRPADEVPVRLLGAHRAHTVEPWFTIGAVEPPGGRSSIEMKHRVMHGRSPWLELDGANRSAFGERNFNDQIAEDVLLLRRQQIGPRRLDDQVGHTELPAGGDGRCGSQIAWHCLPRRPAPPIG